MRELNFTVPKDANGKKLKYFLREDCQISSSILKRLKWVYNGITVNGTHSYVTRILQAGDTVQLILPEGKTTIEPNALPITLLWEDEDLFVLNKPSNMPVHPSPGHDRDSVANAIAYLSQERGIPFSFHPIFRLDKNTSGILVIAKNCFAASRLAFGIQKTYYAVCEGVLTGSGTIDAPIRLKEGHGIQREVGGGDLAQSAVTHWKSLRHNRIHTLLEIHLETGRTHQIRVHFSEIGHPLAGDDLYGGSRQAIKRQALHCGKVCFTHPVTKEALLFEQPIPEEMQGLLQEET